MKKTLQGLGGTGIALLLVLAPWWYYGYRKQESRNFRVVRPHVLYRSGQLSLTGLERVIHDHGIKTVVTFRAAREADDEQPNQAEEAFCHKLGLNYFRIATKGGWLLGQDCGSADERVRKLLEIVRDPQYQPVLVHCYAGIHRTGAYVAACRIDCEGWESHKAIEEMIRCGYHNVAEHQDVYQYLVNYQSPLR